MRREPEPATINRGRAAVGSGPEEITIPAHHGGSIHHGERPQRRAVASRASRRGCVPGAGPEEARKSSRAGWVGRPHAPPAPPPRATEGAGRQDVQGAGAHRAPREPPRRTHSVRSRAARATSLPYTPAPPGLRIVGLGRGTRGGVGGELGAAWGDNARPPCTDEPCDRLNGRATQAAAVGGARATSRVGRPAAGARGRKGDRRGAAPPRDLTRVSPTSGSDPLRRSAPPPTFSGPRPRSAMAPSALAPAPDGH